MLHTMKQAGFVIVNIRFLSEARLVSGSPTPKLLLWLFRRARGISHRFERTELVRGAGGLGEDENSTVQLLPMGNHKSGRATYLWKQPFQQLLCCPWTCLFRAFHCKLEAAPMRGKV